MAEETKDGIQQARDAGLKCLGRRDHTVLELREKLRRKGFPEEVIGQVIDEFRRLRLLDDREFARKWVESRIRNRPVGSVRLARDLKRRGIDRTLVAQVLEEFGGELDTLGSAVSLLRRQRWRYAGLEEGKARRRMMGFLARRGYGRETVKQAIDKVWEEFQRNDLEGD